MNPVALLLLLLAIVILAIAFKGHQDNLIAAVTGKPWHNSTLR